MFRRVVVSGLSAVLAICAVLAGCSPSVPRCVLEAEKAVAEPEYDENSAAVVRANSRSENITSDGKYVGKMYAGNTVTWFFTAERQANCEISLAVSNAEAGASAFDADAKKVFSVCLNGEELSLPVYGINAATEYCDGWQELKLGEFRVEPGVNKIVYTALSDTERLNVDYLALSSARADIKEHSHFWKSSSTAASCTEGGYISKSCDDCGYSYESGIIPALGHKYGNYHYHDELQKMVAVCERCGESVTANTPNSKYFGEVFYGEEDFSTRPDELIYEAEDAYVCLDGGLNNGTTYIKKDDGNCNDPSGGKLVENISNIGNYIKFCIDATEACAADLVFRMSNVLYSPEGIAVLDPMSDYVYCTVNGESVDFTFVSFPGFDEHSYFEWRYVVVKNAAFTAGENYIEIGPKENERGKVTMPNCDVLKIYSDGAFMKAVKYYNINDVYCGAYDGENGYGLAFEEDEGFYLYAGEAAQTADFVITVTADESVSNFAQKLELTVNESTVNFEGVSLAKGENTVVLKGVPLKMLKNTVAFVGADGVTVTAVKVYTSEKISAAYGSEIKEENDYLKNGEKTPALISEAENADLGDSVSSREEVELVEENIYENSGKPASGNSAIGNFAVSGNKISWKFTSSAAAEAEITLMLSSANYDSSISGNVLTDNLHERIVIKINGVAVKLDGITLTVDSISNYYDWKALTVVCLLNEGENEVTIEALGYGAPNMDVMYVYTDAILKEYKNATE